MQEFSFTVQLLDLWFVHKSPVSQCNNLVCSLYAGVHILQCNLKAGGFMKKSSFTVQLLDLLFVRRNSLTVQLPPWLVVWTKVQFYSATT
jgi:hypothetical protein